MNRKFKLWMKTLAAALVIIMAVQMLPLQVFAAKKDTFTTAGTEQTITMPEGYEPILQNDHTTYTLDGGRCGMVVYHDDKKDITIDRTDLSIGGSRMGVSIDWRYGYGRWNLELGYNLSIDKKDGVVSSLFVSSPDKSYRCDQKSVNSDGMEIWSDKDDPDVKVYVESGVYGAVVNGKQYTYNADGVFLGIIDVSSKDTIKVNYNADGTYKEIEDAAGRKYQFTYTAINGKPEITKIAVAGATVGGTATAVTYDYITVGEKTLLRSVTYPDGQQAKYEYDTNGILKSCNGVSKQLSFYINKPNVICLSDGQKALQVQRITYDTLDGGGQPFGYEYLDEKGNVERSVNTISDTYPIAFYDKDWNIVYSVGGENYVRNGLFCPDKGSRWNNDWSADPFYGGLEYLSPGGVDMRAMYTSYLYQDVVLPNPTERILVLGIICGEIYESTKIISNKLGLDYELKTGMNMVFVKTDGLCKEFDLMIEGSAVVKRAYAYDANMLLHPSEPEEGPEEVKPSAECPCLKCETVDCACRCQDEVDCKCKQCESPVKVTYDKIGNQLSTERVNQGLSLKQTNTYDDKEDFLKTATDENGITTKYNYSPPSGILNSTVNAYGAATSYTYDPMGRVIMQSANDGKNTMTNEYAYTADRLSKITHNGVSYGFTYDGVGRLLTTTLNGQSLATYSYSRPSIYPYGPDSKPEKISFANGQSSAYRYTDDKLTQIDIDNDGKVDYNYNYNGKGELQSVYDNVNQTKLVSQGGNFVTSSMDGRRLLYSAMGSSDDKELTEVVNGQTIKYNIAKTETNDIVTDTINGSNSALRFSIVNTSDAFKRLASQKVTLGGSNTSIETAVAYKSNQSAGTTGNQVEALTNSVTTSGGARRTGGYRYEYDAAGNITKETAVDAEGAQTGYQQYTYDKLSKLTSETTNTGNKTTYTYDAGGNLKSKIIKKPGSIFSQTETLTYDDQWKDLLVSYNGQAITHDAMGNTTGDGKWSYTWQGGRQLAAMASADSTLSYRYNADGLRTQKTVVTNGVQKTYDYIWANGVLVGMQCGSDTLRFIYENSKPVGFLLNEATPYFYVKNLQGDICEIVNGQGESAARYTYDAWGNLLSSEGNEMVLALNPFTYRGYQYDQETGLYYLQSRYYNPQWGRFINADTNVDTQTSLVGTNVFAYGDNNPVMRLDPKGTTTIQNMSPELAGFTLLLMIFVSTIISVVTIALTKAITGATGSLMSFQSRTDQHGIFHISNGIHFDSGTNFTVDMRIGTPVAWNNYVNYIDNIVYEAGIKASKIEATRGINSNGLANWANSIGTWHTGVTYQAGLREREKDLIAIIKNPPQVYTYLAVVDNIRKSGIWAAGGYTPDKNKRFFLF